MPKYFLILIAFCFNTQPVHPQYKFINKGRILFERKINAYAILPEFTQQFNVNSDGISSFIQKYKTEQPQFWTDSFHLVFDKDSTLYQPAGKTTRFLQGIGVPMAEKNQVLTSLSDSRYIAEKNAFNESRIISDTIRKIRWKLTEETREIAGFDCRRANGLINDSVYIVAFYTDAIKTKGGPELFNGLPGMILGIALPYLHISYFATRIEEADNSRAAFNIPPFTGQGKSISQTAYFNEVIGFLKDRKSDSPWIKVFVGL
jgi:GLPGLI family protein